MADDWKPGDKGVCIVDGPWGVPFLGLTLLAPGGPQKGDVVTVNCVHPSPFWHLPNTCFVGVHEHPGEHYDAVHFRKIPPSSEEHIRKLQEPFNIKEKADVN